MKKIRKRVRKQVFNHAEIKAVKDRFLKTSGDWFPVSGELERKALHNLQREGHLFFSQQE